MPVDAVILAGAPAGPEMISGGESISRAMVKIGPKTMLQWIVDALKSVESIREITAIGEVEADGLNKVVKPRASLLENLMLGVETCGNDDPILALSSDIPLITAEAVDDFLNNAIASGGDMCYPIITKESCLKKYPGVKRTYFRTREGTFTGGNMMLLSPEFLRKNEKRISEAYTARKKPLKLAGMISYGILLRAALAQVAFPSLLPVPMLEHAVSRMLDGKVVAILTEYPEIGEDVDKAEDLEAVRGFLI